MRGLRAVVTNDEPRSNEFGLLVDRLAGALGKLGREREDVLQLVARFNWAQLEGFHGSCASLNYSEAEMVRRDLRGSNNPSVAMFALRLLERPAEVRDALAVLARAAGCRLVVDDAPALNIHEAKAELQETHADLQALIDRKLANDGMIDPVEAHEIGEQLVKVSERLARVGRAVKPKAGKSE